MDYAIVEFLETNQVAVIPVKWTKGNNLAFWPPHKDSKKTTKAVVNQEKVDFEKWDIFSIRVLRKYANYKEARSNLQRSEETSNLESEVENSGPRNRRQINSQHKQPSIDEQEKLSEQVADDQSKFSNLPSPPSPIPLVLAEGSGTFMPPGLGTDNSDHQFSDSDDSLSSHDGRSSAAASTKNKKETTQLPKSFENYVIQSLERLHEKVDLQGSLLVNALQGMTLPQPQTRPETFKFPLQTTDDVDEIEEKVSDDGFRNKLTDYLAFIGGSEYKDNMTRILQHILTDELASKFAWEGIRKSNVKRPFKALKIKDVIFEAIRRNPLCKKATDAQLKTKGGSWLAHAPDRIKAKNSKQAGILQPTTPTTSS